VSEREAVLRAIAFGDDPKIAPGDRLRALELLGEERGDPWERQVREIPAEELDHELDVFLARWPRHPELERRFPKLALALEEEAERRAREIADAARAEERAGE
jgi:hypothetical protein